MLSRRRAHRSVQISGDALDHWSNSASAADQRRVGAAAELPARPSVLLAAGDQDGLPRAVRAGSTDRGPPSRAIRPRARLIERGLAARGAAPARSARRCCWRSPRARSSCSNASPASRAAQLRRRGPATTVEPGRRRGAVQRRRSGWIPRSRTCARTSPELAGGAGARGRPRGRSIAALLALAARARDSPRGPSRGRVAHQPLHDRARRGGDARRAAWRRPPTRSMRS